MPSTVAAPPSPRATTLRTLRSEFEVIQKIDENNNMSISVNHLHQYPPAANPVGVSAIKTFFPDVDEELLEEFVNKRKPMTDTNKTGLVLTRKSAQPYFLNTMQTGCFYTYNVACIERSMSTRLRLCLCLVEQRFLFDWTTWRQ